MSDEDFGGNERKPRPAILELDISLPPYRLLHRVNAGVPKLCYAV